MSSTLQYEFIKLAAHIADMKREHYDEFLSLHALVAVLVDKGIVTEQEISLRKSQIDAQLEAAIPRSLRPME